MDVSSGAGSDVRAGRKEWIGLAVLALPTLLLSLDMSALYLALPHLSQDLGASATQQLWITDIYGFLIAGFLVTMGTLGDRVGRRRLLLIGAVAFAAASVAAAYSTSAEMLIISRALMGIAGATLMPSTMSLLGVMFKNPQQMGIAIAVWMSCFMGGMAIGPVVGGVLLVNFWWGSVFLLGVPVMALLLLAGPKLLPEYRDSEGGKVDLLSVALSLAAILPVIYGLKEVARGGWQPLNITAVAVGLIVGVLFVQRQRRLASPLLDMQLFRNRSFSAALVIMVGGGIMSGTYLLVNLYLQTVEGLSPLQAGAWLVPSTIATIFGVMAAPAIARKIRPGYVMAGGLVVTAAGYLLLTQVGSSAGVALLVTGLIVSSLGAGPMGALGTGLIMGSVPPEKAGSASAMSETSGEFGIAFGIAVMGSVGTAVYQGSLGDGVPAGVPAGVAQTAQESIAGAYTAVEQLSGPVATQLLTAARDAFTSAMNTTAVASAAVALVLATVAAVALRHAPPTAEAEAAGQTEDDPGAAQAGTAQAGTAHDELDHQVAETVAK
ncbi:MFS transporter [Nonomuraea sp. SBT364]|uniref:MFS transporter n=1 Tax=Nonomuraea sp. SBT364 TaxID=1580530 RepID=UPI00066E61EF|nr:MFS transporter [Nonomuraea sp. SBT364]